MRLSSVENFSPVKFSKAIPSPLHAILHVQISASCPCSSSTVSVTAVFVSSRVLPASENDCSWEELVAGTPGSPLVTLAISRPDYPSAV